MTRGVYATAGDGDPDLKWLTELAALCARYPDGRIGGEAGAALLGLDGFDPGAPACILRPRSASGRGDRVRRIDPLEDPSFLCGLPVCDPGELLLGLGADITPRPGCAAGRQVLDPVDLVELAVEAALRRGLVDLDTLERLVTAHTRRAGRAILVQVLAMRPPGARPTESYAETRCCQVLRTAGVADFERQVDLVDADGRIGRVDFLRGKVVIEVVGEAWHLPRFHPDHERYARLAAAGYTLLPFTFTHIEHQQHHVIDATVAALRRNG
jgi:very-short-patch-repair endonuclease